MGPKICEGRAISALLIFYISCSDMCQVDLESSATFFSEYNLPKCETTSLQLFRLLNSVVCMSTVAVIVTVWYCEVLNSNRNVMAHSDAWEGK